jgi:ankyrin repeat protein
MRTKTVNKCASHRHATVRAPGRCTQVAFLLVAIIMHLAWVPHAGAQPASRDAALIRAAEAGNAADVKALLTQGASVHARDANGRTALVAATYGNRVEAARLLIAAGADVNAQDDIRNSAFLLAGARGYLEIVRMTLGAGADLKSTNRYGGTALIPACHYGHVETVRELLRTKIDVDHVNNLGWTALLEAVILGDGGAAHTEIVRLLLAAKANPNIADRDGVSPLEHAKRRGFGDIAKAIAQAGGR